MSTNCHADPGRAFRAACTRLLPPGPVVVAVSAGADSMALLELVAALPRPVVVYHLDHGLRPEAAADAILIARRVADLRRRSRCLVLVVERSDIAALATQRGIGLEQAGRDERYRRLLACAQTHGASAVLTAHHRQDLAETALMNLLRGSDLTGLAAIPERRALAPDIVLVRPLLRVEPARLRGLLRRRDLAWNEDQSNRDPRFRRNRIRHHLLPVLRAGPADLVEGLAQRALRAQARWRILDAAVDASWQRSGEALDLDPLLALDQHARSHAWRRLVRDLELPATRASIARLEDLAHGASGRRLDLAGVVLWRSGDRLRWERPATATAPPQLVLTTTAPSPGDARYPVVDADAVAGDLVLRHAVEGERWQPLGAPGSRPVLRSLADRGISPRARRQLWLVADAAGVAWIPGYAIAERLRIGATTRRGLGLRLES